MPPRRRAGPSGADVVSDARRYLGVPYRFGGTDRRSGLDCSGLVLVVCEDLRIGNCPRTSEEQWAWVNRIHSSEAGPGDLVFLVGAEIDPPPGHVGIVVAPGKFIDAPFTGAVVREDDYSLHGTGVNRVMGFGRIPGVSGSLTANRSTDTGKQTGTTEDNVAGEAVGGLVAWVVIALMFLVILGSLVLIFLFMVH